jgi:hypothetical protein
MDIFEHTARLQKYVSLLATGKLMETSRKWIFSLHNKGFKHLASWSLFSLSTAQIQETAFKMDVMIIRACK